MKKISEENNTLKVQISNIANVTDGYDETIPTLREQL
jgi:hypothetical protein